MLLCWRENPKERLAFADLVITIESILTKVAHYLDFNEFVLNVNVKCDDETDMDEKWTYPNLLRVNVIDTGMEFSQILICNVTFTFHCLCVQLVC